VARLRQLDQEGGRAIRAALEQNRLDNAGLVVCGIAEAGSDAA